MFRYQWLFLAVCFLLSCGKERTLNVNEQWSIDPPLGQIQDSPIMIILTRNFSSDGSAQSKLEIQVSGDAASTYSNLNISIANQNFGPGSSSVNFTSLINQEIRIENAGKVISSASIKMPHGFFLTKPTSEKICYRSIVSADTIRWDETASGMITIEVGNYSTQTIDYGFWKPEFDVVQALYPNTQPDADPSSLADKAVNVSFSRAQVTEVNKIPITIVVKEIFPSAVSFHCEP